MAKNPTPEAGPSTPTPAAKTPAAKTPAAKTAAPRMPVAKSPASKTAVTPAVRTKAKPAVKPQLAAAAKPEQTKPAPAGKPAKKPAKAQSSKSQAAKSRPVLVRDSFTMPEADFALIARLKSTALGGRRAAKKSELLRAGLHLLAALDPAALVAALDGLQAVKTGRPKKGH